MIQSHTSAFTQQELVWHYEHPEALAMAALCPKEVAIREELRCGYSSKRCENVRTNKKGGGMHRFCEFHRRRANKNQWRVDNKRRMMQTQKTPAANAPSPSTPTATKLSSKREPPHLSPVTRMPNPRRQTAWEKMKLPDPVQIGESGKAADACLSESDIDMLRSILFDGEDNGSDVGFLSLLQDARCEPSPVRLVNSVDQVWLV